MNNNQFLNLDSASDNSLDKELENRINKLERNINNNINEFYKLGNSSSILKFDDNNVNNHFLDNLNELNSIQELIFGSKDEKLKERNSNLLNKYRTVEIEYINRKINLINSSTKESLDTIDKKINDITGNILFSVIAIVLGLSLVSSMVAAADDLTNDSFIPFFAILSWIIIYVLGISYMFINSSVNKIEYIYKLLITFTIAFGCIVIFC